MFKKISISLNYALGLDSIDSASSKLAHYQIRMKKKIRSVVTSDVKIHINCKNYYNEELW